ncbi:expressed unknown protein [Ectocarpus siliculosus]|uniref:Uncharacterized protein n=1 Tax=Ectocarpus siliculosus TaxID=2880 RepID=D7G5P8_ECTSI|nr:expressed unknown protein [Ectocarpus siliculosus]|eukprot:CBJ27345.1 expressed unknown protein [Ectocarpus siliculosus]
MATGVTVLWTDNSTRIVAAASTTGSARPDQRYGGATCEDYPLPLAPTLLKPRLASSRVS